MPRAEEFAADGDATPETTNPARRSRFSLPWRLGSSSGGTADDDMDSGLNDRLLADGDDSAAGGRGLARCGAVCRGLPARCCPGDGAAAGGKSRRPLFCGCCAALVLLLVVYGAVLYHAYAGLVASMPDLLIAPVKVSGFCDKEFVARGRVTMNNRASWAVHVTAKSSKISLSTGSADSAGPVAFSMHSDDRMGFAGGATTPQDATQLVTIEDPAAAGRFLQDFAVLGEVSAHVEVQMVVEISLLPGSYSYPYISEHKFSSKPIGAEAAIPGCLNGSTVQQQSINRLKILQNDAVAARGEMSVTMSWYKAWSFTAEFPPTEWRLLNKVTREPVAYMAVPAAALKDKSAQASMTFNASVPREYAVAAGDAFRRTMDLSEISMEMVGTGHAGSTSGQCQQFAKLLENFVYPVFVWDAAKNATYNRDPYAPGVNPCKPSQVEEYVDALLDVTSLDLVRSNGTHAWLKAMLSANITDGLGTVGTTAKLSMLNSTKIPPMRVGLHQQTGELVMTAGATFDGCLSHFSKGPKWCKQASATIVIESEGTGMAMDHVIADFIASEVSNFTMRISGMDVVRAAAHASTAAYADSRRVGPMTVLATVGGAYAQPVHVDLVSKGLNGTRSRIDAAVVNYTDHNGIAIEVSPRYPAPIVVSGQYNDTVQRMIYKQTLQVNAGRIGVDVQCEGHSIGSATAVMDPSTGKKAFPLAAQVYLEDALNTACLGGRSEAVSSDGDGEQPPLRFFARMVPKMNTGPDAKPFLFNSSYIFANSSDGSMDFNLSSGFKTDSICHSPVPFTLTAPAPDFLTFLGDIDVTAQSGHLVYDGKVGAALEHTRDPAGWGPHVKIRGEHMIFNFLLHVDDPLVIGSMINIWYATWIDLVFQLTATTVSIVSAPTNPVSFSHSVTYLEKGLSFDNTASVVTDTLMSLALPTTTDVELAAKVDVLFNLTESVAQGWGFPPFDIPIPPTHWHIITYGPEGYLNYSLGTLQTFMFPGKKGAAFLGPVGLLADTTDHVGVGKFVGAFVTDSLGCSHKPWRTLEQNRSMSIQLEGDTSPAYQEQCIFQTAMAAVSFPVISYPYSDNATRDAHNFRVDRLQLTTTIGEAVNGPSVELVLVMGNGTDASIKNILADLPSFNLVLYGQLEAEASKSELLRGMLNFDRNRFHGLSSAALGVGTVQVGQLLNRLVETSMDNISLAYSIDVTPATETQGFLASVLHGAADAASTCILAPTPAPSPPPPAAPPLLADRFASSVGEALQSLLGLAGIDTLGDDPLDGVGTVIEVETTSKTLAVVARANISAAAAPLTRLIGNESLELSFGELGVDLYRGDPETADVTGSAIAGVRVLSLSTEEIAVSVNTSAGAAMAAVGQLAADYLMKPRVDAVARVVIRGKEKSEEEGGGGDEEDELLLAHEEHETPLRDTSGHRKAPKSPEVDVDIDVTIPGSGDEFPCDPKPPTPDGTCPRLSGYVYSFSPVSGVCVYLGAGLKGLAIEVTVSIPNPLPLPFTVQDVNLALHATTTNSAGAPTQYNTIATAKLSRPVTIPPQSTGTVRGASQLPTRRF